MVIFLKRLKCDCILFLFGGVAYALLEILWRRKTHWSMAITGGTCFVSLFRLYKKYPEMTLRKKCILGSIIITLFEGICGFIVNIKYKLNVWDYSKCILNYKGQICLLYSVLWALLCIPISAVCEILNKNKKIL